VQRQGRDQNPDLCKFLTPKGFQESKKKAWSREEAGARANSHRHFLCWEMCFLLVPRELALRRLGVEREAVWAAKLAGVGFFLGGGKLGKTTPLSLPQFPSFLERIMQTVEITKHAVDIEEKGVRLRLTIVDTPGFGDAVNNTEWYV
jgi:hypothetical protein